MYDEGMCPRAVSSLIGASLVEAVMSTFSSHNCRPSTVFSAI